MGQELEFFKIFLELFNINSAIVIFFLCAHIIFNMHKLDMCVVKARLFLNDTVLHQVWTSISIAGVAVTLNAMINLSGLYLPIENIIHEYYLLEMTQFIFLMAFICAIFSWYQFLASPVRKYFSLD